VPHRQADAMGVRFETHCKYRALELAGNPRGAMPPRKAAQHFQLIARPENSLAANTWHGHLPNTTAAGLYVLEPETDTPA
jgi:hypothetical protein